MIPHHRLDGAKGTPVLVLGGSLGTTLDMWDGQLDPHALVGDQRLTGLRATGQDMEDSLGEPGLLEDASERHAAAHGGAGVGLEHDGVAQRERRCDRADGEDQREVERGDDGHDPRRHAAREAQPGCTVGRISPSACDDSAAAS